MFLQSHSAARFAAVAFFIAAIFAPQISSALESADELMRQVYEQGRIHKSQRMNMEIRIKDSRGRKRVRFFKTLYLIDKKQTKSLLRFYKPSDVKGTGLFNIVYDKKNKENDQWIYFPAFRTVSKLGIEDKNDSFMGSDFTNADIAGRKPAEDTHTLLKADEKNPVVSSVPRNSSDLYSKIETHIISRVKVPEKIVFYDRSGKRLKTLTSKKIAKIEGMYVIVEAEMENHLTGGSTYLTKREINFKKISSAEVSVAKLKNR